MKTITRPIAAFILAMAMFAPASTAQAADIKFLCSNGLKAVVDELGPRFEKETGHKLVIVFEPSTLLQKRIDGGEPFDLAVLTTALVDEEVKAGKLVADSRTLIARTGLGLSVRAGAKKPDVQSVEAFTQTLRAATSITYATQGASAAPFEALVSRLGLTAQLTPKYKRRDTAAQVADAVASGSVEIGVAPISEILPVKGIELVGPFPSTTQSYVNMTAGIGANAKQARGAMDLIRFLSAPANAPTIKAKGMEAAMVKAPVLLRD